MQFRVQVSLNDTQVSSFVRECGEFVLGSCTEELTQLESCGLAKVHATIEIEADGETYRVWVSSSGEGTVTLATGNVVLKPNRLYELRHDDILQLGSLSVSISRLEQGRRSVGGLVLDPTQAFPRTPHPRLSEAADDAEDASDLASTIQDDDTVQLDDQATQVYMAHPKDVPTLSLDLEPMATPTASPVDPKEEPQPKRSRVASPEQQGGKSRMKPLKLFYSSGVSDALSLPGCKKVDSWSNDVSALVAPAIKRTVNFVIAVSRGIPILDPAKLHSVQGQLDVEDRELWLQDSEGESKWGFSLAEAIDQARKAPVLAGHTVHVFSKGSISIPLEELKAMVNAAGGTYSARLPSQEGALDDLLVILGDNDKAAAKAKGVKRGYSQAMILDSALSQTLDLNRNRIEI
jgi:hypothetical protein